MAVVPYQPLVIVFNDGNDKARISKITGNITEIVTRKLEEGNVQAGNQEQKRKPVFLQIF
jgi:hypothetical protein